MEPLRLHCIAALSLLAFAQAGCATTPKSCRGLAPQQLSAEADGALVYVRKVENPGENLITRLQCDVDRGDRVAMLHLGIRYEAGDGVSKDVRRAAELYRQAAADTPQNTAIYSPPVRQGGSGQVMLIPNGNAGPGLARAKYRLGRLYLDGRGVERDEEKGRALIGTAATLGDEEAKAFLGILR